MIRAVLLDIDDTLLSFEGCVRQTMREGLPAFGLGAYREDMYEVARRVNVRLWGQIECGELDLAALEQVRWNTIFSELGLVGDGVAFERYFKERLFWSAVEVPGARELVERLRGRVVLCAASNGPNEQQVNRLRVAGMLDSFDHVFISERLGAEKPSREFFDACFAELGDIAPAETLIVGDSLTSDMAGGAAYGLRTCLYRPDAVAGEGFSGVDHVVTSLLEVPALLDRLG